MTIEQMKTNLRRGLSRHQYSLKKESVWFTMRATKLLSMSDDKLQAYLDVQRMSEQLIAQDNPFKGTL